MNKDMCVVCDDGILNIRVGAIIMKDGKILMVGNDRDYLYSVGGRVKFGETAEEAVVREVLEETGVQMEIDRLGFAALLFGRLSAACEQLCGLSMDITLFVVYTNHGRVIGIMGRYSQFQLRIVCLKKDATRRGAEQAPNVFCARYLLEVRVITGRAP